MCLIVVGKVEVQVAKEDIECFKVLNTFGDSPYRHLRYPVGAVVESELDETGYPAGDSAEPYTEHYKGLHSFATIEGARYEALDWNMSGMTVYRAVIPAGARYLVGVFDRHRSYSSTQLKLVERVGSVIADDGDYRFKRVLTVKV